MYLVHVQSSSLRKLCKQLGKTMYKANSLFIKHFTFVITHSRNIRIKKMGFKGTLSVVLD